MEASQHKSCTSSSSSAAVGPMSEHLATQGLQVSHHHDDPSPMKLHPFHDTNPRPELLLGRDELKRLDPLHIICPALEQARFRLENRPTQDVAGGRREEGRRHTARPPFALHADERIAIMRENGFGREEQFAKNIDKVHKNLHVVVSQSKKTLTKALQVHPSTGNEEIERLIKHCAGLLGAMLEATDSFRGEWALTVANISYFHALDSRAQHHRKDHERIAWKWYWSSLDATPNSGYIRCKCLT